MKEDEPYIQHILDAIDAVEKATRKMDRPSFVKNELIREYAVRKIEIIGEAAKHLSNETRQKHKEIPWSKITGMRDRLIHQYMGVDFGAVWDVVESDLPPLKKALADALENSGG